MEGRSINSFTRKEIWQIAAQYAHFPYVYSHQFFETEYEITESTFYSILNRAVIWNIVDDKIVQLMQQKAVYNSNRRAGRNAAKYSNRHYDRLKAQRTQYMLSRKVSVAITEEYARTDMSKGKFCNFKYMTESLLNRTIKKCIICNWIPDETVELLKKKSMKNGGTVEFWNELEKIRERNKNNRG